jgi:hypothetical protein
MDIVSPWLACAHCDISRDGSLDLCARFRSMTHITLGLDEQLAPLTSGSLRYDGNCRDMA